MSLIEPEFSEEVGPEGEAMPEVDLLPLMIQGENLVEHLGEGTLGQLALEVQHGFDMDESSMEEWARAHERGIELAQMMVKDKTFPWSGAANAKYPLIASAALQFNARAYPAIVAPDGPVRIKVWGKDETGEKAKRGERVSEWMAFKIALFGWESQIDSMLMALPVVGTVFRKVWHDEVDGLSTRNCVRVVLDNRCADLKHMPRLSEEFDLYPHEIRERISAGRFVDFDFIEFSGDDSQKPQEFIEQLCRYDLDGDGYPEPLIVTLHKPSSKAVRIEANFREDDIRAKSADEIISITPRDHYEAYRFLPSFDGTFLGVGLGMLLGNMSEQIDGIINRILDAATLNSLGAGFIGGGLNLKKTKVRLEPGKWMNVPEAGSQIRDSMVPLTFPEPSPVLFQMLGLLIEAGREIASVKDVLTGDVQANIQPTTLLAMIDQGEKVFTAAYRRIYRSLRNEFYMMAKIEEATVTDEEYQMLHDEQVSVKSDFRLGALDIMPVADPREVTSTQRMGKAQLIMQMAQGGLIDQTAATRRVLEVSGITDIDELMPQPDPQQQAMAMREQAIAKALQMAMAEAELEGKQIENAKTASEIEENRASAVLDMARAEEEAGSNRLELLLRAIEVDTKARQISDGRRPTGMAGKPGNGMASEIPEIQSQLREVPTLGAALADGQGQP
ncbi:MAG: hypothetical protein AB8B85_01640 [Paracoccaceae bacterium]